MRWLILILFITNSLSAQFTYSGYMYNANGSGASNVAIKLYRRTNQTITGFTNQQNYNGHSYYRSTGTAVWTTARTNCSNMGGHLVTITTSGEQSFIYGLWPSGWIGLTDEVTEGTWKWVTGETYSYKNWNNGEPNNSNNEDYVQFVSNGRWNDLPNNQNLPYVLEFEYLVTTSSWALYKTIYTNSAGYYSISEAYDPSKEYYIELVAPTRIQAYTNTDIQAVANVVLNKTTRNGLSFHMFDVNDDKIISVADKYYVAARKAGRFSKWRIAPDVRIFTLTEYNAIKAATTNVRSTYPGISTYTTGTLTTGQTLNLYIIAPGYAGAVTY
jgi:Lectin C-type domain